MGKKYKIKYKIKSNQIYSEKESQSNDVCLHFEEFSNVDNSGRSLNATPSNLVYKNA